MNISIEKVDAINYVMTGIIDNSVIDEKVKELKAQATQQPDQENAPDDRFEQAAAAKVFQAFIDAGVHQAGIPVEKLLGQPGLKAYEKQENSVKFVVDVATAPQIDTDVDYMAAVPDYTKPEADPAAVEAKLSEFVAKQAPLAPITTPRALQDGDTAVIDFTGYLDGEPFEGGSAKQFNLTIGSGAFIPGFEEQLIGMNYGDTRTIDVTFPQNYQAEDLAGKTTQFEVTLNEIRERQTIEPDDAFARQILGDESATLETLKGKLAEQVVAEALSELYNNDLRPKLVEGLLERFDFPLPNNIVEQEIDAKIREKLQHIAPEEQAKLLEDKAQYLALRESVREEARNGIKIAMIVEALAEKEGVSADEQEVIAALTHHAMTTGQDAQAIVKYYQENNLMHSAKLSLTEDKLFGKMLGFDR